MNTGRVTSSALCERFGIDFPLFAFSHCRDVVAAVTNAGGFGVLGATAYTPEQLDIELSWIDDHVHGKPYGADIIVPTKFEGKGEKLASGELAGRIPAEYRDFVAELLAEHDIESDRTARIGGSSLSGETGRDLMEVAMSHQVSPYVHDPEKTQAGARTHDFDQWAREGAMEREASHEILNRWRREQMRIDQNSG